MNRLHERRKARASNAGRPERRIVQSTIAREPTTQISAIEIDRQHGERDEEQEHRWRACEHRRGRTDRPRVATGKPRRRGVCVDDRVRAHATDSRGRSRSIDGAHPIAKAIGRTMFHGRVRMGRAPECHIDPDAFTHGSPDVNDVLATDVQLAICLVRRAEDQDVALARARSRAARAGRPGRRDRSHSTRAPAQPRSLRSL